MLRWINTAACGRSVLPAVLAAISLVPITGFAGPAFAAPSWTGPAPAEALDAFRAVDAALRSVTLGEARSGEVKQRELASPAGCVAADVTVWLGREVVARGGSDLSDEPVSSAANAALRELAAELATSLPAEGEGTTERALRRLEAMLGRLRVSVELAGPSRRLLGASFADAASEVEPGLEAMMVRTPAGSSVVFPGLQLRTRLTPASALRLAAGRLDLPPVALARLSATADATAHAMGVTWLAQSEPGAPPTFLFRGGEVLTVAEVGGLLRPAAMGLARHLERRLIAEPAGLGLRGLYVPTTGVYEEPVAPPRSQALVALAMARFAGLGWAPDSERARAGRAASVVLASAFRVESGESDPLADPVASALWLAGASALERAGVNAAPTRGVGVAGEGGSVTAEMVLRAADAVLAAVPGEGGEGSGALAVGGLSPEERATAAFGLALGARLPALADRSEQLRDAARLLLREALRRTPPERLVGLLPWAGWAELELTPAGARPASETALATVRELAWSNRVETGDASRADLVGGLVFASSSSGGEMPSAQTVRPLAFFATMLGDERLTPPEDVPAALADLRPTLRFVLQLATREAELSLCTDREPAAWGVRAGPIDFAQPPDASALTLLTLAELFGSMEAIGAR